MTSRDSDTDHFCSNKDGGVSPKTNTWGFQLQEWELGRDRDLVGFMGLSEQRVSLNRCIPSNIAMKWYNEYHCITRRWDFWKKHITRFCIINLSLVDSTPLLFIPATKRFQVPNHLWVTFLLALRVSAQPKPAPVSVLKLQERGNHPNTAADFIPIQNLGLSEWTFRETWENPYTYLRYCMNI